jgi:hypothetical protein
VVLVVLVVLAGLAGPFPTNQMNQMKKDNNKLFYSLNRWNMMTLPMPFLSCKMRMCVLFIIYYV